MKSVIALTLLALTGCLLLTGCSKAKDTYVRLEPSMEIKSDAEKGGYVLGVENGENIRKQFEAMNVDLKALSDGLVDELYGRPKKHSDEEIGKAVDAMRRIVFEQATNVVVGSDIAGYGVGVDHAKALRAQLGESGADLKAVAQGFSDEIHGKQKKLPAEEIQSLLQKRREQMIESMLAESLNQKNAGPEAAKNAAESQKFLEENAKNEGVKTTASGLQYQVLKEGSGDSPHAHDTVTVHYRGTLLNGEVFDSSYDRNEPASFPLDRVIKGWTEGLQLMKVGSKYKFFIPPQLAYGQGGAPGGKIGPNSALIFEVELLKVEH